MAETRAAMTRQETAARYGVGLNVISEAIHSGQLRAKRVGRQFRVHVDDAEAWFAALPDA